MEKSLIAFIKEARKRGFSDLQIRNLLIENSWPIDRIEKAFKSLAPKYSSKNQICLFLDSEILEILEKRAKKNLFTVSEQIEDILRRSCIRKTEPKTEKLDDLLISFFSKRRKN